LLRNDLILPTLRESGRLVNLAPAKPELGRCVSDLFVPILDGFVERLICPGDCVLELREQKDLL
jgi:hypothetical protein